MIDILQTNKEAIESMCGQFGMKRLDVFGSAARGDFNPETSDLDFLIEFHDNGPGISDRYFGFIRAMEEYFGMKVDTVFGPRTKSPYLQKEIDNDRELLYEAQGSRAAA